MNEVKLIVELCGEDRARLDTIIEKLDAVGKHPDCSACAKGVADSMAKANAALAEDDPVKKAITDALAKAQQKPVEEAPKNAQEATEASAPPSTPKTEEMPWTESPAPEASAETVKVSTAELQQLVIALCRAGKKANVREIISTYGVQTVAAIPDDKRGEVFAKLKTLEG